MNSDRNKFRVYLKKQEKYICEEDEESAILFGDGSLYILCQEWEDNIPMSADLYYGKDSCIVEHCTGIKDKNGTLIYEGDVVKFAFPGIAIHVVGWCTKTSRFVLHEINQKPEDVSGIFAVSIRANEQYEVVGNINEWRGEK